MTDPADDEIDVNTGYGMLRVPRFLFNLWNRYGWPTEETLRLMHADQNGVKIDE